MKIEKVLYANKPTVKVTGTPEDLDFIQLRSTVEHYGIEVVDLKDLKTKALPKALFFDYAKLKHIILPDMLVEVPESLCFYCIKLEQVEMGKNVKVIGEKAFAVTNLKEVIIPKHVEEVKARAYCSNKALEIVQYIQETTKLDELAFENCPNMKLVNKSKRQIEELEA